MTKQTMLTFAHKIYIATVIGALGALLFFLVHAQEGPRLMITWRAVGYAPPTYQGKILPTANSFIVAALELVDGGKLADLSGKTVYWYLNGELLEGGEGVQRVAFRTQRIVGSKVKVRVQIPDYGGEAFVKTIEISTVRPEVTIEAPFPEGRAVGSPVKVRGVPYFFNTTDAAAFSYSWKANGKTPEDVVNPELLEVNLSPETPDGFPINITLEVKNTSARSETAFSAAALFLQR